ncbi:MAG: recombinase family protein [Candidatus Acidiferrales bacterium]
MKKVIELIRVSTQSQAGDDRASIPSQKAANRRTAQTYGLHIAKTIEITDVSGTAVLRAPEMQDLLRLIESPEITGVVVREFSRVMRPDNFGDYVLFQAFQDTGTLLYLPDGPLDLNSKTGKLVAGLRAIIAGNELSEIRERVWSAKEEMRRAGKNPGGDIVLPYGVGYTREQGYFYKPEAEHVREAFRRLLSGETSYTELGKPLDFTPQGMHTLFTNPIYNGWRVYDKKRDMASNARRYCAGGRQGDRPKIRRDPDEVIRVKVITPPLVSDAEFRRVQEIVAMKTKRHWRHRPGIEHRFTYNGFLQCAECDSTVYGRNASGFYYCCRRRFSPREDEFRCATRYMQRDRLEGKLDGMFAEQLTDRKFITGLLSDFDTKSEAATARNRIVRLETEIKKLREKRQRILDTFFEGLLSKAERDQRLTDVDTRLRMTEEMLLREAPIPTVNLRALMTAFAPLFDWQFMNRESKRRILAATVPEIHVSNYQVRGISVTSPSFCGAMVTRTRTASLIATELPERIFIPLSL